MALAALVVLLSIATLEALLQIPLNSRSSAPPRGSMPRGKWECAKTLMEDVWQDENYGPVKSQLNREEVLPALKGKWLMLIGDSSMRMVYHLLLGALRWDWHEWPHDMNNHGPSYVTSPKNSYPSNCSLQHNFDETHNFCLQETLHDGARLSFMWLDYADEDQLSPLAALQQHKTAASMFWPRNSPDTIVLSMGAWHLRAKRLDELQPNMDGAMMKLANQFPDSHKIVTGTPNCNSNPEADTATTDRIQSSLAAAHLGWVWFDRGAITRQVCEGEHACRLGWPHPSGAPLNAVAKMLLWQVEDAGTYDDRVAKLSLREASKAQPKDVGTSQKKRDLPIEFLRIRDRLRSEIRDAIQQN